MTLTMMMKKNDEDDAGMVARMVGMVVMVANVAMLATAVAVTSKMMTTMMMTAKMRWMMNEYLRNLRCYSP